MDEMNGMDGMMGGWGPGMMIVWIVVALIVLGLAAYGLVRLLQESGGRRRGGGEEP